MGTPALLGLLGWAAAGPLVATLLIGRTGLVPSLRWLLATVGTWLVLGAAAWLARRPEPTRATILATVRAAAALPLLAGTLPLLALLYASDSWYHRAAGSPDAPRAALAAYAALLGLGGCVWTWASGGVGTAPAFPGPAPTSRDPLTPGPSPAGQDPLTPGPSATRGEGRPSVGTAPTSPLPRASSPLPSLGEGLGVRARPSPGEPGTRSAGGGVRGMRAPVHAALAAALTGPALMLAANDLVLNPLARRISPPPPVDLPAATDAGSPALLLTLGAVAGAALALAAHAWRSRDALRREPALAASTATVALLLALFALASLRPALLWPPIALIALGPLLLARTWRDRPRRQRFAAGLLVVAGLPLAGTSREAFGRAATELLGRWPALAELPLLGVALLAAALGLLATRDSTAWQREHDPEGTARSDGQTISRSV